jgi:hypothetical protein
MKKKSTIFLSVIIPSYNEKDNLKRGVLEQVHHYLKEQDYPYEVILSDDGSTDGTLEELQKFAHRHQHFQVIANDHAGKGPTVASGMLQATGDWCLFTDFDQSTPLNEIEKLWPSTTDHEVVIGSRAAQGAKREREPIHRHVMGVGFNLLVQLLVLPGILDSQCGFKLFSAKATKILFSKLYIYARHPKITDAFTGAFDVEVLFLARKKNFDIAEIPVLWKHRHSDRVAPIKDSFRMLRDIIKIRLADIAGHYDKKS